jgi:biopolymer transport protein ExbD
VVSVLMISACSPMQRSDVVTLEVLGDGTFVWNGQPVPDAEALDELWKTVAAQDPQPEIHLKPNPDAKYDAVERALKGAQSNGVYKLGFVGNVAPQSP